MAWRMGGLPPIFLSLFLAVPVFLSSAAYGADPQAGRAKASACVVCHGPLGVATAPSAPHLAGQPAMYLEDQLRRYRDGSRRHEQMTLIAKPLTDDEIENLAAWFSSIRIQAAPP